jgi:hypothetical protein
MNPEEIRRGLQTLLDFAGWVAKWTPTQKDDEALAFLRALVDTPGLIELLARLLRGHR